MNRRFAGLPVVALAAVLLSTTVQGQTVPGVITATGMERVRVQPKAIRLVHEIQARGKTAVQAVRRLQAQRDTALAKLKELGAIEDSICFTPASLARDSSTMPSYCPLPAGYAPSTVAPLGPSDQAGAPTFAPPPSTTQNAPGSTTPQLGPTPLAAQPTSNPDSRPSELRPTVPLTQPGPSGVVLTPKGATYTFPSMPPGVFAASQPEEDFVAQTTLIARWPINENKPDDITLVAERLREKLAAAKLDGNNGNSAPQLFATSTTPLPLNCVPCRSGHAALDKHQTPSPASAIEEPLELSLEDTAALRERVLKVPRTSKDGYNPYDAAPGVRPDRATQAPGEVIDKGTRKPTDLRKLSEWIRLQRRVQTLKQQDQTEDPAANKGPRKK